MVNASTIQQISHLNSFYDAGTMANTLTSNLFWGLILISIYVIILMRFLSQKLDTSSAFATTSFVCFILSLPLVYLGWVVIFYPIGFLLILGGSLTIIKLSP